jgi:hypothetical protein
LRQLTRADISHRCRFYGVPAVFAPEDWRG